MRAKKSLGQNFLMHAATAERIADAARLTPDSTVLEIGPGTGMLTRALLARAGKVIAVEADGALVERLRETFAEEIGSGRLELIHQDVRELDTTTLPDRYAIVANIPYYITGEILRSFLSAAHKPVSMTLLVQKEVAERITLRGPTFRKKKESLLSLSVKAYGTPRYDFPVPRGAFVPAPNVDSAVITIAGIRQPFASAKSESRFFETLRAGFAHPRKRLAGNLTVLATPERIMDAFMSAGIPNNARPEDVKEDAWRLLAEILRK